MFDVDPVALDAAIKTTRRVHGKVREHNAALRATFKLVEDVWHSRSSLSFSTLAGKFELAATEMEEKLDDAVRRLETVQANITAAEQANVASLSPTP
ncbi:WXG100 family type VII secretion target [Rhizomonospora bruguierae]|uniref:WXG100 family type VII secretion target n=1 Tax=Rhizomonospora bruguierae TaxID=1581705 RepID=UPI001BCF4830|nr:WXG100 family type VII secretion target [Micromonospora sp. NBRC 107566]